MINKEERVLVVVYIMPDNIQLLKIDVYLYLYPSTLGPRISNDC